MRVGRPIMIKTLFLTKVFKQNSVPDAVVGALRSLDIVVRLNFEILKFINSGIRQFENLKF